MLVATLPLDIGYESEGFPSGSAVANGPDRFRTSWDDLLWAAVTVGRPNRQFVFQHGHASEYEALFRLSLVRMALEQQSPYSRGFRLTSVARSLDPSEKGAVSYFLGLIICKLFAAKRLGAPWLLHLDVFRDRLNPSLLTGRSRPDLVGEMTSGGGIVLECKGRGSVPDAGTKKRAKQQAERLIRMNGSKPAYRIGGIAYFRNHMLRFYWQDPEPTDVKRPIDLDVRPDDWRHYYAPVLDLIRTRPDDFEQMLYEPRMATIEEADVRVGIHPHVLRALSESLWDEARGRAGEIDVEDQLDQRAPTATLEARPRYQADGIAVEAGDSWKRPFEVPV